MAFNFVKAQNEFDECAKNNGTILQEMVCLKANYQLTETPTPNNPFVLNDQNVTLSFVKNIDFKKSTLTVIIKYSAKWKDDRIVVKAGMNNSLILLTSESFKQLWIPHVYFKWDLSDGNNIGDHHFSEISEITSDSEIFISGKIKKTFGCEMKLMRFPFDTQECQILGISKYQPASVSNFGPLLQENLATVPQTGGRGRVR